METLSLEAVLRQRLTLDDWVVVLKRDPCCYCDAWSETVEHVIPQTEGGRTNSDNLVGCCRPCNHQRGSGPLLAFLRWNQDRVGTFDGQPVRHHPAVSRTTRRRRGAKARQRQAERRGAISSGREGR